jgi:hypothetical protein
MEKIIRNNWVSEPGAPFERARILEKRIHPEGLDIDRIRFIRAGLHVPDPRKGHIISMLRGSGRLTVDDSITRWPLRLGEEVHVYLPPGCGARLDADPGTELLQVSADERQAGGSRLLIRDEEFLFACATENQSLRWILTPQYLSRRIFLHHDRILLSRSGDPVSWFRTTMFDVSGLPENEDGEPVFKMSYNSRTECNVCYHVAGTARVRMACHPYAGIGQRWNPWEELNGETTYHLNEAAGGIEEEIRVDGGQDRQTFRNKHEVFIRDGHVTLFCLFDPAPTGVERHRPGEYSDYEPLSKVLGTPEYEHHRREIARYDEMVDELSLAKAMGELEAFRGTPAWEDYILGRDAQVAIEAKLTASVAVGGTGRARVLAPWLRMVHA